MNRLVNRVLHCVGDAEIEMRFGAIRRGVHGALQRGDAFMQFALLDVFNSGFQQFIERSGGPRGGFGVRAIFRRCFRRGPRLRRVAALVI